MDLPPRAFSNTKCSFLIKVTASCLYGWHAWSLCPQKSGLKEVSSSLLCQWHHQMTAISVAVDSFSPTWRKAVPSSATFPRITSNAQHVCYLFRYFAAVVHVIVSTWILRGEFTMLFFTVLLSFCVMSWFRTRFLYSWFNFDSELSLGSKRVNFVLKEGCYMLLCMQSCTLMPF